jgi:hypothetical protein
MGAFLYKYKEGYMADIKQIADKFLALPNPNDSTVRTFTHDILAAEAAKQSGQFRLPLPTDILASESTFAFLNDTGNGPISVGLQSLELMSRVLARIPLTALVLFDVKIVAYSAQDIANADTDHARTIVLANLLVEPYYRIVQFNDSPLVTKYNTFLDAVAVEVRSGFFRAVSRQAEAITLTREFITFVVHSAR